MTNHRYRDIALLAIVVAIIWTASQLVRAQDKAETKGTLIINLTSGSEDLHRTTMALQLAGHGLDDGRKVVVFLNVRAPELAGKDAPADWAFNENPPAPQMLTALLQRGAVVMVCPHCMHAMGIEKEKLVEGAVVASRESLFANLDGGAAVFSY